VKREPGHRRGDGRHAASRARRSLGRRFDYLWATFAVASLGDGIGYGAVPLLALIVDRNPIPVASVAAADTLPWLVLALPAGALADRYERGRLMAVINLARGPILATLAVLVATHHINLVLLLLLVFANGGARAIYYSASQATVPELIEPGTLARANGILGGTEAATEHLGGPVLGTIGFAVSRALPFAADAVAVGVAGLSLLRFRTERPERGPASGSILDGAKLLMHDRALRLLVTLLAALAGLQGLVGGVLVLVATRRWGLHQSAYGAFLAAGAVGNVPGALLASRTVARIGNVPALIGCAVLSGLGYLGMAFAHGWLLGGAAFAFVGFAIAAGSVIANSLRQRLTPAELMGRVGSAWRGIVWGAFPIGSLIGGGLATVGGLQLPLLIAGVAQCAIAVILTVPLTRSVGDAVRGRPSADGAPAVTAATVGGAFSDPGGEQATAASVAPNQAVRPDADAPRVAPNRRVHSRSRRLRPYQGRSPRTRPR
jgi:MFS family permease